MNVINLRKIKGGNFIVFLFEDATEGTEIMFRLIKSYAVLIDVTKGSKLISGFMAGFNSSCTFIEAQQWIEKHGIELNLIL